MMLLFRAVFILLSISFTQIASGFGELVTCDIDLPKNLHTYLPTECVLLTAEEKALAQDESDSFLEWKQKIEAYEKKMDPESTDIPQIQWELRQKITNESLIWQCQNGTSLETYYQCLTDARQVMISMIPSD